MKIRTLFASLLLLGVAGTAGAGAFLLSDSAGFENVVTHPKGYSGTGGVITVGVCITPGTQSLHGTPAEQVTDAELVQPIKNVIATWNRMQPTHTNLDFTLDFSRYDIESLVLHEMGHCIGLHHPNLSTESGQTEPDRNYTKSTLGADGVYDLGIGADATRGSKDDARDDDVNLHWRNATNDPFTLGTLIDSTTYSRTDALPSGSTYTENADRTVSALRGHTNTEAVMQQGQFNGEGQRNLGHDDVATLLMGQSGTDKIAGTADDYSITLVYNGISTTGDDAGIGCDITVAFGSTGFGVCSVGLSGNTSHLQVTSAAITITDTASLNWIVNSVDESTDTTKCHWEKDLTQNQWTMFSLPCDPTSATVADVLGDDLGTANYGTTWILHKRNATTQAYEQLTTADTLLPGQAYWLKTTATSQRIDVTGAHLASNLDWPVVGDSAGRFNFVGSQLWYVEHWADVVVMDGITPLTLDQADPDISGTPACQTADPVGNGCIVSRTAYTWNGSTYDAMDGTTVGMEGTVSGGGGFWVKVYKSGVTLRFVDNDPSLPDDVHQEVAGVRAPELPPVAASAEVALGLAESTAAVSPEWAVRLIASADSMKDSGNVLGQLDDSQNDWDSHDLLDIPPFGPAYLNVVFPRTWAGRPGDYSSDFRMPSGQGEWTFSIKSNVARRVTLTWLESAGALRDMALVDSANSSIVPITPGGKYTFRMRGTNHSLRWVYGPRARQLLSRNSR